MIENDCGDPEALSVTVNVADSGPMMLGLIVRLMVQVTPAASEPPHNEAGLVANAKSPELTPLRAIALIVSVAPDAEQAPPVEMLPLQMVTVCAGLVAVTAAEPSATVAGFTFPLHR